MVASTLSLNVFQTREMSKEKSGFSLGRANVARGIFCARPDPFTCEAFVPRVTAWLGIAEDGPCAGLWVGKPRHEAHELFDCFLIGLPALFRAGKLRLSGRLSRSNCLSTRRTLPAPPRTDRPTGIGCSPRARDA